MPQNKDILLRTIDTLPLSESVLSFLWNNQIVTLEMLLAIHLAEWQNLPGFSYHIQHELLNYLEENELREAVKE